MTSEENIEIKVEEKKINLEEEFKKLKLQLDELSENTKVKDELLEKAAKDKQDLERQYNLLADTHQLLKDNIKPVTKEEEIINEVFKNSKEDVKDLTAKEKKMLYDIIVDKDY